MCIRDSGTVATGRIESGIIQVGDDVELLGLGEDKNSVVTGVEMFRKLLDPVSYTHLDVYKRQQ